MSPNIDFLFLYCVYENYSKDPWKGLRATMPEHLPLRSEHMVKRILQSIRKQYNTLVLQSVRCENTTVCHTRSFLRIYRGSYANKLPGKVRSLIM